MRNILPQFPEDAIAMGNIDPVSAFKDGTPELMRERVLTLMNDLCEKYPNFVISSGCDSRRFQMGKRGRLLRGDRRIL